MAKFRNVVVHHYDTIDAEIVVGILKRDLDDFLGFQKATISLLEQDHEEQSLVTVEDPAEGPEHSRGERDRRDH
jgi:hypothetical protein